MNVKLANIPKNQDWQQITFKWFCQAKINIIPVCGTSTHEKALQIAELFGVNDFKASSD